MYVKNINKIKIKIEIKLKIKGYDNETFLQ